MQNPLLTYRQSNPYTWAQIANLTGLSTVTLGRIAAYKPIDAREMKLFTHLILKDSIGVDFEKFVNIKVNN